MSIWRQALLIARRDFRLIVWRREGIAWIFVMPLVFFYVIGMATGGLAAGDDGTPDPLWLEAPADAGFLIDEIAARLEQQNFRVVRDVAGAAIARHLSVAPADDATSAPTGSLTDWALDGNTLTLRYASNVSGLDASFEELRVARAVFAVLADAVAIDATGGALEPASFAAMAAQPRALRLDIRSAGRREDPPTGFAQTVPGTMVMFVMLIALTGSTIHLVIERNQGLLRRLAVTPVPLFAVILGKLSGRAAVALAQVAFAMVAGSLIFAVDWGPSLPMVALILGSWALFNAALALLFANLVRTEGQASGIGVMASMTLAALGGAWWPIEITPDWMQTLAMFLPTGWAMDALHKLVNFAYGPAEAVPQLLAILAATLVVAWAGARTFRYS